MPQRDLDGLSVALVHDWLDEPGGAENALLEMMATFPSAEVWSSWCRGPAREIFGDRVATTWLARTPLAGRKALSLPLMPIAWRSLPARRHDIVISSSYAFAHTARFAGSAATHLHYVYTPGRYWWVPDLDRRGNAWFTSPPRAVLRAVDRRLAHGHQWIAAISSETRRRIQRFWGVDAEVIHPPVDTDFFCAGEVESPPPFPDYILGVSRFVPYKRLDSVIRLGARVGLPVVIAGAGPGRRELERLADLASVPVRIEYRPSRARIRDLYRGAHALVFPAHEDFGIVPVEAIACGIPVVGVAVGGLLETVQDGVSGRLAPTGSIGDLAAALAGLPTRSRTEVAATAQRFSRARFRAEFAAWVRRAALGAGLVPGPRRSIAVAHRREPSDEHANRLRQPTS